MTDVAQLPIGVFDSGVGGLTVVKAISQHLPQENMIYFGDTARVPYGVKSVEMIAHYARQITEFLLEKRVKMLVVACNSMAAVANEVIRDLSDVPVLDVISAGALRAVAATRVDRVAVIGTLATINSGAYIKAIQELKPGVEVVSQACPLFVPLVEEGWLEHSVTQQVAQEYLALPLQHNIDSMVLGCTHYPLLKPLLQQVVGDDVQLIDSAETVARQIEDYLQQQQLKNPQSAAGRHEFYVTDVPQRFQAVGERFLGQPLQHVHVVNW